MATRSHDEHPARRPEIERWIEDKGASFNFVPDVPVTEFDLDRSLKNQARINQVLNEVQLATYVEAMQRGDVFPAVIAIRATRSGKGKYVAIDGNHRLQAAKMVETTVSVYELDPKTDPNTVLLMTYEANAKHGLPNSVEDRVKHAVFMIENVGISQDSAAASLNLTKGVVSRAWLRWKSDQRADKVGLRQADWESLTPAIRQRLGSISADEVFSRAADLAYRAKLTAEETDAMVVRLNRESSVEEQKKIVTELAEIYKLRIQKTGGGVFRGRVQGPRHHLFIGLGHLKSAYENEEKVVAGVAPQEIDSVIERCEAAARDLQGLIEALEKRRKEL